MTRAKKTAAPAAPERTPAELEAALVVRIRSWIERLQQRSLAEIASRAHELGHKVAGSGDVLLFRGQGTDEAIALYAEALACLAFVPGGIEVLGQHFEAHHPEPAQRTTEPQPARAPEQLGLFEAPG